MAMAPPQAKANLLLANSQTDIRFHNDLIKAGKLNCGWQIKTIACADTNMRIL